MSHNDGYRHQTPRSPSTLLSDWDDLHPSLWHLQPRRVLPKRSV
jgi:hypothetical protein